MKKIYNVITRHSITMNNVFATSILFCQQKLWRGKAAEKWNCWKLGKNIKILKWEKCRCVFPVDHPREHRGGCWRCTVASLWVPEMLCCLHLFTPSLCPAWLLKTGWISHHRWQQWVMPCPAWFVCVSPTTMFEKPLIDTYFTNFK